MGVNLLRTKIKVASDRQMDFSEQGLDVQVQDQKFDSVKEREKIINFLIVLSVPLVMFAYERLNIAQLKAQHMTVYKGSSEAEARLRDLQTDTDTKRGQKKKAELLQSNMNLLAEISKRRLVEIKALDAFQYLIPERAWIRSISYDSSNGKVNIDGGAVNQEEYLGFVSRLNSSPFFENTVTLKNQEAEQGSINYNLSTQLVRERGN